MGWVLGAFLATASHLELVESLELAFPQPRQQLQPKLLSTVLQELEPWEGWCQAQQVQYQGCRASEAFQVLGPRQLPPPPKQLPKLLSLG